MKYRTSNSLNRRKDIQRAPVASDTTSMLYTWGEGVGKRRKRAAIQIN
jgi:hypothetical protein